MFLTHKSAPALLSCLALAVSLTGCGGNEDPVQIAERATRELGVPVFLWAYNDDKCAVDQAKKFFDEYRDMSKRERRAFKERLKARYQAVIVNATLDTRDRNGTMIEKGRELTLTPVARVDANGNRNCGNLAVLNNLF